MSITADRGGSRRPYRGDTPRPPGRTPADEILHVLLGTEEGRQNPYLLYKALRDIAPLFRSELDGHWYASRYDDCRAILVDPRAGRGPGMLTRYGQNPALAQRFSRRMRMTMIMHNPPEHTRLRGVVSRAFTPRRVAGLEERIGALLEPMLDDMADAGEIDFMGALAFKLPVSVIGELVGVPEGEREQFRDLVRRVNRASRAGGAHPPLQHDVPAGRPVAPGPGHTAITRWSHERRGR